MSESTLPVTFTVAVARFDCVGPVTARTELIPLPEAPAGPMRTRYDTTAGVTGASVPTPNVSDGPAPPTGLVIGRPFKRALPAM